jgi:hypothetical protein
MRRQVVSTVLSAAFRSRAFELCEDLFDRIEIGAVRRLEEQLGAGRANGAAHGLPFVTSEIVHKDNFAGLEGRHQRLLDIGEELGPSMTHGASIRSRSGARPGK